MGPDDFSKGFEYETRVSDWITDYLACKHEFQKAAMEAHVKVSHYMLGPQLDASGEGLHFQFPGLPETARSWSKKHLDFLLSSVAFALSSKSPRGWFLLDDHPSYQMVNN